MAGSSWAKKHVNRNKDRSVGRTMDKENKLLLKITIALTGFLLLGTYAISPAMASISAAMPDKSATQIQMVIQLPMLMSVPFLLCSGILSQKVNRKHLMIAGLCCYIIGGAAGAFTESYAVLVCSRCLLGFGIGILNPCNMGLISYAFFGTDEYAPMVGVENAFRSLGGMVSAIIAGWLCLISWHHAFLVYLLGIPVLLFTVLFVPSMPPQTSGRPGQTRQPETRDTSAAPTETDRNAFPAALFPTVLATLLSSFCINITNSNVSYLIEDQGFGNSTISGYCASLFTLFCVVGSVIYTRLAHKNGNRWPVTGLAAACAGLFICSFAPSLIPAAVGVAILGTANGIVNPSLNMQVGSLDRERASLYFSFNLAGMNLGATLQGLIVPTLAAKLFGTPGVGAHAYRTGGIVCIITIVWTLFVMRHWWNRRRTE